MRTIPRGLKVTICLSEYHVLVLRYSNPVLRLVPCKCAKSKNDYQRETICGVDLISVYATVLQRKSQIFKVKFPC